MFPSIRQALREFREGQGADIISLGIAEQKATFGFSTVAGPDTDWYERNGYRGITSEIGGGYSSHAGVSVTEERAFEVAPFYAGVKIIAEDMGSLPFFTYERSRDRKVVNKAYGHRLFPTLHGLVNPEISSGEFVEALTAHALVYGNGFAEVQFVGNSIFLYPWQPSEVTIDRDKRGRLVYIRKQGNSPDKDYPRDRVFHLRGFTLNGTSGDNLLKRARHILGISAAAQEYAGRYFAQDATPGIIIERPAGVPMIADLTGFKRTWSEWHRSVARSHEPAVLQEGMKATKVSPHAAESQLLEQRAFQVIEACRELRLSPHKLADLSRATFSNIEHLAIEHVTNTLRPWGARWKNAVHRCLLSTDEQAAGRIYAEHEFSDLLRGDFATQSEGFRKLLEKGVYSINEVRRWLNLNPVPGGEEHFVQLNLADVQAVAAGVHLNKPVSAPKLPTGGQNNG